MQTRSTPGSSAPSGKAVERAALVLHGRRDTVADAVPRVRELAEQEGVELVDARRTTPALGADLALVLGGDGTMLRTLGRFLGTGIPVAGVNFGAVGFLTSIPRTQLEDGLGGSSAATTRCSTCRRSRPTAGEAKARAVNDIVAASSTLGRMVEPGLVGRRRGPRRAAVRRRHLRHAVRLDRLQPLERRARCSSGAWRRSR